MAHHLGIFATLVVGYTVLLSLSQGLAAAPPYEAPNEKGISPSPWSYCPAIAEIPPGCPQPKDCAEVLALGYTQSGVYTVYVGPDNWPVEVYCDQVTDGGGWLVFQKRRDGFTDFYRPWNEYANGFGELHGEHWLGNHFINLISQQKDYGLRVDMEDFTGSTAYAEYSTFKVAAPHLEYQLTVTGYSGTAGDSLVYQNGMKFSTYDQDNDIYTSNCASIYHGAWWYGKCHGSNLNANYHDGAHTTYADGINWKDWKGYYYSLKTTVMMLRPL